MCLHRLKFDFANLRLRTCLGLIPRPQFQGFNYSVTDQTEGRNLE